MITTLRSLSITLLASLSLMIPLCGTKEMAESTQEINYQAMFEEIGKSIAAQGNANNFLLLIPLDFLLTPNKEQLVQLQAEINKRISQEPLSEKETLSLVRAMFLTLELTDTHIPEYLNALRAQGINIIPLTIVPAPFLNEVITHFNKIGLNTKQLHLGKKNFEISLEGTSYGQYRNGILYITEARLLNDPQLFDKTLGQILKQTNTPATQVIMLGQDQE